MRHETEKKQEGLDDTWGTEYRRRCNYKYAPVIFLMKYEIIDEMKHVWLIRYRLAGEKKNE